MTAYVLRHPTLGYYWHPYGTQEPDGYGADIERAEVWESPEEARQFANTPRPSCAASNRGGELVGASPDEAAYHNARLPACVVVEVEAEHRRSGRPSYMRLTAVAERAMTSTELAALGLL